MVEFHLLIPLKPQRDYKNPMIAITDVCYLIGGAGAIATLFFLLRDRRGIPTRGILPKVAMAAFLLTVILFVISQHYGTSPPLAFHVAYAFAWGLTGVNFYLDRKSRSAT